MITVRNTSDGQISERIKLNIDLSNRQTVIGKLNSTITNIYPVLENVEIEPKLFSQTFQSQEYGFDMVTVKEIPAEEIVISPEEEKQEIEGIYKKIDVDPIDYVEVENFDVSEINFANTNARSSDIGIILPAKTAKYMKNVKIEKDENLVSNNIKQGATIFGIQGSSTVVDTQDATAVPFEVVEGKTAYVNGEKIEGIMPNNGTLNFAPSDEQQVIPSGYTEGGYIQPANIETLKDYNTYLSIADEILGEEV